MNYWWTADYHINHKNIIEYCNRPFKSLKQMNDTIIRNHNERVKEEDTVFHIGDFCFKNSNGGKVGEGVPVKSSEIEKQLNGKIIHIKGNHDKNNSTKTIIHNCKISFGGKIINLVHNPEHRNYDVDINFTGHVHEKWEIKRFRKEYKVTDCINVGVDVHNFYPQSFNEIISRYSKWKKSKGILDEIGIRRRK